jgi:hypothetical protein
VRAVNERADARELPVNKVGPVKGLGPARGSVHRASHGEEHLSSSGADTSCLTPGSRTSAEPSGT